MASEGSTPDPGKERFEDLYRQLEEVVSRMEAGGVSIDETIALYEKGLLLYQRCQQMLDDAQLRITTLQSALTPVEEGPFAED